MSEPAAAPRRPWRRPARLLAALALLAVAGLGAYAAGTQLWALHHYRAARAETERYHTNAARAHLEACLKVWPRDPDALLLAARGARRLGDFEQAEVFLARYRERRGPEDEAGALEQVFLRAERGDVDDVGPYCVRLIEEGRPAAPLALEALAHGFLRKYRLREAALCLTQWLERRPDDTQAVLFRGIVHEQLQQRDEAVASYRRVVQLDAEHDEGRMRLCALLLLAGRGGEAATHLEYLLGRARDNPLVPVYLARAHAQQGEPAEAVRLLDGVLAREPQFGPALAERGRLALQAGELEKAEGLLREAVGRDPGDYQSHYQLYQCLSRLGKADEMREQGRRLKRVEDDLDRIQKIVTRDLERRPHDPALRYEAGMIMLRAGAADEGVRWLQGALKEDPDYAPAHRALALYYEKAGNRALMIRHLERAIAAESAAPATARP
ncbi:MAG TPA: tetratricopeptide repeat protein [Gemmataceae bacterium]|nr:tetratricopeptide repeat protein [Gemmataceae bacterium]